MDLYCYKCTGCHSDMRNKWTGKGRMRQYKKVRDLTYYRCIKCGHEGEYGLGGFDDYGIK